MDLSWVKQHKWVVALFGAAAGGFILYSYMNRNTSNQAAGATSPVTGSSLAYTSAGSPQYLVPVVQSGTAPNPTLTTPSSNTPAPVLPTTAPVSPIQPTTTQAALISAPPPTANNAYGVGTKVTSSEAITQSVYDPLVNGWLDLTSKGGIYGSGANVSGSAYSPQWAGSGRLQLINGGANVQEYNSAGSLVGTYKVGA